MSWTLVFGVSSTRVIAATAQSNRTDAFTSASQEFGVPLNVLSAVAYNETHWQTPTGVSIDGGYGLMDLRTYTPPAVSGRDGSKVTAGVKQDASYYTLDQAAQLLQVSTDTLKTNDQQNIRGAAAILAQDARKLNGGTIPNDTNDWYSAVAEFSGSNDNTTASAFADDVFATIKSGASLTTVDGQVMSLPAVPNLQPNKSTISGLHLQASPMNGVQNTPSQNPECPATLDCRFIPAAYAQNDPNDPTNYGNYDHAHRPADMPIKYIYIHDAEGSYNGTISQFQDPSSYVSAQYVVRSSDGAITQMVPNADVSWGVYDWYDNMHGINIENEGFAAQGASWYTPAMYQKEATLVRWLAAKYNIPLDRQHILGHDNIPTQTAANLPNQHWDPGPFWDWNYFMNLVQGKTPAQATSNAGNSGISSQQLLKKGNVVTISPNFSTNKPLVTDCQTGICTPLVSQGASFVYLHTQPSDSSPLLTDLYNHPDGSAGTTQDSDWGDKAPNGSQYVVADVQGSWTGVWYAGKVGWFYNPSGSGQTAYKSNSLTITPMYGKSSIPVYGVAYPEAAAYPAAIPVQKFDALYTIPAGQLYSTTVQYLPTDYFYDATINSSLPLDHMIVHGGQLYYQISLNHRIGYVKATDVILGYN